jgi:hypothetical protein
MQVEINCSLRKQWVEGNLNNLRLENLLEIVSLKKF